MLETVETDIPAPGPDQVLIRVRASSVNRPDIMQREGRYPPPPGESEILGLECAGTIEAAGELVSDAVNDRRVIGKRVFALLGGGGYAEYAVADYAHTLELPETLSFEQAACIAETWITAWLNLFELAGLQDGETVLIHGGGGGVGTAAIQLVRALRPGCRVITTASAAKLERLTELGAHEVIDYNSQDFAAVTAALTNRSGADVILDHIGAPNLNADLKTLATEGRLVVIGIMGGSDATISLGRLMVKRQKIIGSVLRSRPGAEKAAIIQRFREHVMPLFAGGLTGPVIDSCFELAEVATAHRRMENSEHFGKIVLTVQS